MKLASALLASLVLVEIGFARALLAWDFGGRLLSAGTHTPLVAVTAGVAFLALRLVVYVLGPGAAAFLMMAVMTSGSLRFIHRRARS